MADPRLLTVSILVELSKEIRKQIARLQAESKAATVEELELARAFFSDRQLIPVSISHE